MSKKPNNFDKFWFARTRLVKSQKNDFDAWLLTVEDQYFDLLAEYCHEGYKLSVKWDDTNNCYIASMTCHDRQSVNYQGVMTSRASDVTEALMMNIFKHQEVEDGEIWSRELDSDTWG